MASGHGASVMKNLCYSGPRHPRTNKPATQNERTTVSLAEEPAENEELRTFDGERPPSSRRNKRHHHVHKAKRSVRDSLSDSFRELDDVDEENFYEHLLTLKNEHKKTLKAVEKLYYSEKDKLESAFDLDPRTKISENHFDGSRIPEQFPLNGYDPFQERETAIDEKEHFERSVTPKDHIRDMSVRDEARAVEHKDNEGNMLY